MAMEDQLAMESVSDLTPLHLVLQVREHLKTMSRLPATLAEGVQADLLRQITSVRPRPRGDMAPGMLKPLCELRYPSRGKDSI